MFGSALRAFVISAILTGLSVVIAVFYGRTAGLVALVGLAIVPMGVWLMLPRSAHRAFRDGNYARSRMWYRGLRLVSLSGRSRTAIDVSLAACDLATEKLEPGMTILERVDKDQLGDAARAAWLNNRAYALARSDGDKRAALDCCDQALALRPDVAGFRHTRGVVLLSLGRIDEAIHELERLWDALAGRSSAEHALLEAERCYDLGVAWEKKGQPDYAADYFQRAHRTSPGSHWARRAASHVGPALADSLSELFEHR